MSKPAVYCFLTYLPFCRLTFTPIFVSLQDISTSPLARSKIFSKGKCCCKGLGVAQQMRKGPIENWKVVSHPRVPVVVIFPLEWVRQNKPSGTRRSCNNKSCQSDVRKIYFVPICCSCYQFTFGANIEECIGSIAIIGEVLN